MHAEIGGFWREINRQMGQESGQKEKDGCTQSKKREKEEEFHSGGDPKPVCQRKKEKARVCEEGLSHKTKGNKKKRKNQKENPSPMGLKKERLLGRKTEIAICLLEFPFEKKELPLPVKEGKGVRARLFSFERKRGKGTPITNNRIKSSRTNILRGGRPYKLVPQWERIPSGKGEGKVRYPNSYSKGRRGGVFFGIRKKKRGGSKKLSLLV